MGALTGVGRDKAVGLGGIMHQSRPLAAASAALVCGSIASASGVVVQIAGHEADGKSVIAAVSRSLSTIAAIPPSPSTIAALLPSPGAIATAPPGPSTTPSTIVPPPSVVEVVVVVDETCPQAKGATAANAMLNSVFFMLFLSSWCAIGRNAPASRLVPDRREHPPVL